MRFVAILLVLLGIAGASVWRTLNSFNQFDTITREFAGRCTPVTGVAGPEDLALDPSRGLVFISSLDRRDPEARGGVHIVDPSDPLAAGGWRDMTGGEPSAFKPLGLSYYEGEAVRRLFVVNSAVNAVELFDIGPDGALTHLETFAERRLTSPNNIVAVGPRAFYVTNDIKSGRDSALGELRFLTRAADGEVFYHDGVAWRVAAEGLRYANGVAVSDDGAKLYVAETSGKSLRIYDRDASSGALRLAETIMLAASPDNLSTGPEGAVWIGGLPKPLTIPAHGADPTKLSPSIVMRLDGQEAETIYLDDGSELSGSTAALRVGDQFLVGALFENKFLICDLP